MASILFVLSITLSLIAISALSYFLISKNNQFKEINNLFFLSILEYFRKGQKEAALTKQLNNLKDSYTQNVLFDTLTGLPSKIVFEDRLEQVLIESKRFQLTFAILFLDIDEFQVINDALGHDVGDELLKEVAVRLRTCIRQLDTISRFNSDQFVVILPQLAKAETAVYVAKRFLDVISQPFQVQGQELFITGSIGIAVYPVDAMESTVLLKNAANALHQAKLRGRNTYQFYREEMQALSKRELILSSNLRGHSIYQEFTIFYQPQINIETKKIFSMEALLHWHHPDFGTIPLHEFLRLAENSGKITEIGEWTLRQMLQDLKNWESQGFETQHVAVNISLRQLENPHFIYKISQILHETQVDPSRVIFEVSEAILVSNFDLLEKALHMLKHIGVQIAINEFGTGHLALQHLKRFHFDYLKIDAALVQDITVNQENVAIVKMIINLAQSFGLSIIAEGVEGRNQMQLLKELGCVIMQGSLFSSPRRQDDFSRELSLTGLE